MGGWFKKASKHPYVIVKMVPSINACFYIIRKWPFWSCFVLLVLINKTCYNSRFYFSNYLYISVIQNQRSFPYLTSMFWIVTLSMLLSNQCHLAEGVWPTMKIPQLTVDVRVPSTSIHKTWRLKRNSRQLLWQYMKPFLDTIYNLVSTNIHQFLHFSG